MKPPVGYYGGKGRLATWIASLFPPHRVYVEPFAGSAAVLFAKPSVTHEIINDVDDNVVNFMRVLRDRPDELEAVCRATPYSRTEFDRAVLDDASIDDLERARRWWVASAQGFGQRANPDTGWSTSVERGSSNARTVWNRLGRFAQVAARLGTVVIENRDALEVIARYDAADGVMYCDPPYFGGTRSSIHGGRRPGGDYVHEFHSAEEHEQLAEALRGVDATVFVSGYPSQLYDELYAGWTRVERRVSCFGNGRSARTRDVVEVVWSNRLVEGRLPFDSAEQSTLLGR